MPKVRIGYGQPGTSAYAFSFGLRTRTEPAGDHNLIKLQNLLRSMALVPTEPALDLLTLAIGVQIADSRCIRRAGQDGWTRDIALTIDVHDPSRWSSLSSDLSQMLGFLTGDVWTFDFVLRRRSVSSLGFDTSPRARKIDARVLCLFSGGLDSAIGSIDLLSVGEQPLLVSCQNEPAATRAQANVKRALEANFGGDAFQTLHLNTQFRRPKGSPKEPSQRSRSFLFIALAVAAASALGKHVDLIIPENGLIALNVPFDQTRLGTLSTRTAHPHYLALYQRLIDALGLTLTIRNPYAHSTKGEMLVNCADQALLAKILDETVSCGKANVANIRHASHCGACVPCVIRRAATKFWGEEDATSYFVSDITSNALLAGELSGHDIRAMKAAAQRIVDHPEVAQIDVRRPGPLPQGAYDSSVDVYVRGMHELHYLLAGVTTKGA
jgi:hypothetical protein